MYNGDGALERLPGRAVDGGWYGKQLEHLRLHRGERVSELLNKPIAIVKCVLVLMLEEPEDLLDCRCFGRSSFRQREQLHQQTNRVQPYSWVVISKVGSLRSW